MEHKNCCQRVIWELEQCENLIAELKDENENLKDELESVKSNLESEKRLSGDLAIGSYDLREENENLKAELDRSVEQMAELESQMKALAEKYNDLARSTTIGGNLICDFEPVRKEAQDGEQ